MDWGGTVPPIGAGTEAAALRVTLATDSTGVVSVDDNGVALTVDNAGTFATQVDGAALTALQLIDDPVATDDTTTHATGTTKVMGIGAVATPTDGSVEANDIGMPAMSTDRRLHTDAQIVGQDANLTVDLGATDNAVLDAIQAAVEIMDDWDETNRAAVNLVASQVGVAGGTGVDAANALRVSLATDIALPAGTNAIGKLAANSGVDIGDVDVLSIAAGSNLIGDVGLGVRTSGGMTIFRSIDIDETEEEIKATAGQLYSVAAFNTTAAPLYLKFYNATAATVVVGTTTPVLTLVVPGNADSDGAGFIWNSPIGWAFGTAITVACTTGVEDNDTGAPGANACIVNVGYN